MIVGELFGIARGLSFLAQLGKKARNRFSEWQYARQQQLPPAGHSYRTVEAGARIVSSLRRITLRRLDIISHSTALAHIPFGSVPSANVKLTYIVEPSDVGEVVDAEPDGSNAIHQLFRFHLPMRRDASQIIAIKGLAEFTSIPRPFYSWRSAYQAEKLVLRVAFASKPPGRIEYRMVDASRRIIWRHPLKLDPVSFEVHEEVPDTKPHLIYEIWWGE
jgi:hypothetical protein